MKWRIYKEANEILHDTEEWDMFVVNIGWAGPEGYDDIEDGDEAYRAWEKFIEDNDLPVCVGMKFPKGMDVDIKHLLEKQYGFPVENYDIDRSEGAMEFQTPWLEWTPEGWQEKDEVEFVSESNDVNLKKLLKMNGVTKLPSGMKFSDTKAEWEKHRGHAGKKTIYNMCVQLEHAGWKRGDWTTGGIPDGSAVSNSEKYTSPDGQIVMSYYEYYGATAYDNSYYITFKLAGTGVNESDELDDWNDDEPKVYKYYSDEPISPKQFVSLVRSMEQSIEDTFIQNSEYYENADNPWEEFVDDMCQGKSPEEAFELDYYMNSAARKQLPDDIAKYVYANDFDAMQWLRGIFERLMPICKDQVDESSRFGFNVGDEVELISDVEPNRFSGREAVPARTVGEVVAINKPMPGIIKVKIENGPVISVPERKLKLAGTDNEPWKSLAANRPPEPKRDVKPERPEDYYMRPTSYGSPRYTGD